MYIIQYLHSHQLTSSISSDIPNGQGVNKSVIPKIYTIHCLHSHQLTSLISSDNLTDQGGTAIQKGQGFT